MDEMKELLIKKFEEIQKRSLLVLEQLDEEELHWRPNESSNSICNLIIHIRGNVHERIECGILQRVIERNREAEFEETFRSKEELQTITQTTYTIIIDTLKGMSKETWWKTQRVRNKERSNLDMIIQCATHFSEHLGQMMYVGKMLKNDEYVMTSIPRKVQDYKN